MTRRSRQAIVEYWLWKKWWMWPAVLFVSITLNAPQAAAKTELPSVTSKKVLAPEKKKNEKIVMKTGVGTLVFIRATKMAVQFTSGEAPLEEMYLPFSKEFQFKNVKNYSGLGYGDQVKVKYRETVTPGAKAGDPPAVGDRKALELTLVKSVQPRPQAENLLPVKEAGNV